MTKIVVASSAASARYGEVSRYLITPRFLQLSDLLKGVTHATDINRP
jgi:hypothetical protein